MYRQRYFFLEAGSSKLRKKVDDLGGREEKETMRSFIMVSSVSYQRYVNKYNRDKNERKGLSEPLML